MPDTGNVNDCPKLPPTTFSIFTLKNVTWQTYLTGFTVQYCFLFRFVCIELVSLIWFLQIWVAIYVYDQWTTLIKKLMQTYIVKVSGSILNISTVHLNGIWHLIWCYLSKPVLGGHYSIPRGCPLNTGFTVPADNVLTVCSGWPYPPSPSQKKHPSRLYGDVFERVSGCLASSDKSHDSHLNSFGPHSSFSYLPFSSFYHAWICCFLITSSMPWY